MKKKLKTYYDLVPKDLQSVVVLRFNTRSKAIEYMRVNNLISSYVLVQIRIEL